MSDAVFDNDSCHRFTFEDGGIRGEVVRLDASLKQILQNKTYPPALQSLLGEALTAAALLAETIKLDGSLILQVQGDGPVTTLVVQATDQGDLRGMLHFDDEAVHVEGFRQLVGSGRMVITIDAEGAERYQGVVEIEGNSLSEAVDSYFRRSEQLLTRVWLASDGENAGGVLLQQLPDQQPDANHWQHLVALTDTISKRELAELPPKQLLHRLYHQELLRLFQPTSLRFHCACSRQKIEQVLIQLGRDEIEQIAEQEGRVSVECEFCSHTYAFDSVDISMLFLPTSAAPALTQ